MTVAASHFQRLLHDQQTDFAVQVAELVSGGALVGTNAGRAILAGYVLQLALHASLDPWMTRAVVELRTQNETDDEARRRIEWAQAVHYLDEQCKHRILGTPEARRLLFVRKHHGFGGVSRGVYELVRVCCERVYGQSPLEPEVQSWIRGLYVYGALLASPLGAIRAAAATSRLSEQDLYEGLEVNLPARIDAAILLTSRILGQLQSAMSQGVFTPRARGRLRWVIGHGEHHGALR
jgi:hypothetical protein